MTQPQQDSQPEPQSVRPAWRTIRVMPGVLTRMRADRTLLAAAFTMVLLATVLMAAGPLYSDSLVTAGLQRRLERAPVAEIGIEMRARTSTEGRAALDMALRAEVADILSGFDPAVIGIAVTDTFTLPPEATPVGLDRPITALATMSDLAVLVEASSGVLPAPGHPGTAVAIHEQAALLLGLEAGDALALVSRDGVRLDVDVVGTFRPRDLDDPGWWDAPLIRDGIVSVGSFTNIGPFVTTAEAFEAVGGGATGRWRIIPDLDRVDLGSAHRLALAPGTLRGRADALSSAGSFEIESNLGALATESSRALTTTRGVVTVIVIQLATLALYALAIAATLVVNSRAVETAMVRSRGASPSQLGLAAMAEGALIVASAVVLAPWLAALAVRLLGTLGIPGTAGLDLRPSVGWSAYVAAASAGVVCLVILAAPAFSSAMTFAGARTRRARSTGVSAVQRYGVDLALLVVAILGMWQLRQAGSPVTTDLRGRLGADPLLVFAPALGLLAAAAFTVRLVSMLGRLIERLAARNRGLVVVMGAWHVARRPGQAARSTLLVVMAVAIGAFAATFALTWERSVTDQADAAAGADVVVTPDMRPTATLAQLHVASAYEAVGAEVVVPLARANGRLTREADRVVVLGVDGSAAASILKIRPDQAGGDVNGLLAALAEPGLQIDGMPFSAGGDLGFSIDAQQTGGPSVDGAVSITAVIVDRYGLVHRLAEVSQPFPGAGAITIPLDRTADGLDLTPAGPLRLAMIEVRVPSAFQPGRAPVGSPRAEITMSRFVIGSTPLPVTGRRWVAEITLANQTSSPSVALQTTDDSMFVEVSSGASSTNRRSAEILLSVVQPIPDRDRPLSAIAGPGVGEIAGLGVGDIGSLSLGGVPVPVLITGVVQTLPTDPSERLALIVDLRAFAAFRYLTDGVIIRPDMWLLSAGGAEHSVVVSALSRPPFDSADVLDRLALRANGIDDPVTVGVVGSLTLGFGAAALIAVVGYLVSTVVAARQRVTEFALLKALGMSGAQTRRWFLLESTWMVVVAVAVGLAAGVILSYVVLPSLTVRPDGSAALPSPVIHIPWPTLAALGLGSVAALSFVPFVAHRFGAAEKVSEILRLGEDR